MKQLFIVPSGVTYPTKATAMSALVDGQIGVYVKNATTGEDYVAVDSTAALTAKEFILAYGRENSQIISIPVANATITKITQTAGDKFKATITIPAPEKGLDYTVVLVRKGVGFHERNLYTATDKVRTGITDANKLAKSLADQLDSKVNNGELNLKVTCATNVITITSSDYQDWDVKAGDDLYSTIASNGINKTNTGKLPTCDKAYVQNLASVCSQNRGFNNVYADGASIYPAYPMNVAADKYIIYNIHFAYGRKASRTRDEAVWQDVYIAVDNANTTVKTALNKLFSLETKTTSELNAIDSPNVNVNGVE